MLLIFAEIGAVAYANVYDQKFIALLLSDNFMVVLRMDLHSKNLMYYFQLTCGCCGKNGPRDWGSIIPSSCCSKPDIGCAPLYTQVIENYCIRLNRSYFNQIGCYVCCTCNVVSDAILSVLGEGKFVVRHCRYFHHGM